MTPTPIAEVLLVVAAAFIAAWVASYLLHSTIAIALCAALAPLARAPLDRVRIWRFAIIAPFVTASVQTAGWLGAPPVSWDLAAVLPQAFVDWRLGVVGLAGVMVSVSALIAGWVGGSIALKRVLGDRRPAPERLQQEVASLAVVVGCRIPIVTLSDRAAVPAAIGRGEVCIPRASLDVMPEDERRALLAHEVGHLASKDPLWYALTGNLCRLALFQPLNRFAVRRLRLASEEAADDFSVGAIGDAATLARALAGLTALPWTLDGGAAASGSPIVQRVRRLLDDTTVPIPVTKRASRVAALAALLLLAAGAPGMRGSIDGAAHRLPWLAPSREEPNARMLEVRRFERALRETLRNALR